MKFKKLMLVTFILLAILTLGAVSASEDIVSDDLAISTEAVDDKLSLENDVNEVLSDENSTFIEDNEDDGDNPYFLYITEEEEIITDSENEDYDENAIVGGIILPPNTEEGHLDVFTDDDVEIASIIVQTVGEGDWHIDENGNLKSHIFLKDLDLTNVNDGDRVNFIFFDENGDKVDEYASSRTIEITESYIKFLAENSDEGDDDAEDGVIINVLDGDYNEFNLNDDLEVPFAFISVSDDLQGFIRIYIYDDEEDKLNIFFEKSLSDITNNEVDRENEGFTVYSISLNDFGDRLNDILEERYFEIGFWSDEDIRIDNRAYNIEYYDGESTVKFWQTGGSEDEDDEGMHGEGEELENVEFRSATAQNNGVVVVIPIASLYDKNIANNFTVTVITADGDQFNTEVSLDELEPDDSSYYLKVSDLGIEELEIGEGTEIKIIVQFYDSEENPIYYAQDYIDIYNSPYIFDEASIFADESDVIIFHEVPDGVDEFKVIIQKEGEDAVEKTFNFSEIENQVEDGEEGEVWYALKLKDLGITEIGDYEITVKFSEELNYTGSLNVNREMEIRIRNYAYDEESEPELRKFTSVDELVVNMRISENVNGYVNLTIGENDPIKIDFTDLRYNPGRPPSDGRQILLNDLNIQESGTYTIKMEIYDENDDLIDEEEFNLLVTVGKNTVEFNDAYYTSEISDVIKYTISTHLSSGQYYNIYFNDELAGKFSLDDIVITNNNFYDLIWGDGEDDDDDVKFLKIGDYNVNVTFFDGENESATLFTGSFSILSLNMTTDKDVYTEDDEITISFDVQDPSEYYPVLYVELAKGWGYMGPWFDEDWTQSFAGEEVAELIEDGKLTVNVGDLPVGTNYIFVAYYLYGSEGDYEDYDDAVLEFHDLIPIEVIEPVEPVDPALTITIADITEGANAVIKITTNDTFSGEVLVKIGTSNFTVNVANGTGSLPVIGLTVGTYNATAIFKATELFNASEKNTTFTVSPKVATAISALAVTTTYATSKNIVVTLKDVNGNVLAGKTVTVVLNGATKTLTTNDKGQATLAIGTSLAPKGYDATFTFAGDSEYAKSTGTVKVTVKKATPKLTAKKKTFKAKKKSKKYTVTLKTDKGKALNKVKVTLKVNGKKYTATVKKGKATFNLKKLTKKGKYKATVTFAGNKYYNKVTVKKVKITVKK